MISSVAACAGLLFGYDIAVINGALLLLQRQFTLSPTQTEWAASSLLAGCVLGAATGGWLSDRWGRKYILIGCALLFAVSSLAAALPRNITEFAIARVLGGIAIGVSSLLAPLYIAEIAPAAQRGRLVSLQQLAIVSGILLAYFINWILSFQGPDAWRGMFAAAALPSLIFFGAMLTAPESPRWLVQRDRRPEALEVLTRVNSAGQAQAELVEIERRVAEESGTLSELWQPGLRRALLLGLALAILQQWTGINTVLFYGSILLKQYTGGASDTAAIGANVWIGAVNFVATLVAMALIDRWGRRKLLMGSAAGLGAGLIAMAIAFAGGTPQAALVVPLMLCCAGAFAVGLGPGVWVSLSEIFPNRIRGRAMGLATTALWAACCALTFTFLSIANRAGASGAFLLYASLCGVTIVVVAKAPETRNRSLEQIESLWRPRT
jgi:sugar porter (SP) family MFS transporter